MMISLARAGPTRRTTRVVEATPSGTPRSTSGIQNSASVAAQRKSHASVTLSPMTRGRYHPAPRPRTAPRRARPQTTRGEAALREEAERRLGGLPARKERRRRDAEVARGDLAEERAEVGRHREVAILEAPLSREPGPAPVDTAPADGAAQGQHRGRVAVVGAPVAVLSYRAAELGHGHADVA